MVYLTIVSCLNECEIKLPADFAASSMANFELMTGLSLVPMSSVECLVWL